MTPTFIKQGQSQSQQAKLSKDDFYKKPADNNNY